MIADLVRAALSDDLLKPEYQGASRPSSGHCYVASEVLYHLHGGKGGKFKAAGVAHEGSQHWWLEDRETGAVIDLTAEQFLSPVPYGEGRGRGFLTRDPSARAQVVIGRVQRLQEL